MKDIKTIKEHLKNITEEGLIEFQSEAFVLMASCFGSTGRVELGVNALGKFAVRTKTETFVFDTPIEAIKKYEDLLLLDE